MCHVQVGGVSSPKRQYVGAARKTVVMAKLDPEWAIRQIDSFLVVTSRHVPDMGPGVAYFGTVMNGSDRAPRGGGL